MRNPSAAAPRSEALTGFAGAQSTLRVRRRQFLDAALVEPGEPLRDRDALDLAIRRDLGERGQDKGAFEQMWMRQGEAGLIDFKFAERDDIDIENARPPAPSLATLPTQHR